MSRNCRCSEVYSSRALIQMLLSAKGVDAGEGLTQGQLMHFRSALIGEHRFQVDHVPNHWILQRYPVAAQYGSRSPADLDRLPGVVGLAEADRAGWETNAVL